MTEYMYAMGLMDPRIRPFTFLVRQWAREFGVTRYNHRDAFTNFQLTYLCLSFLAQLDHPLIPTYEQVMQYLAGSDSNNDSFFRFNIDQFQFSNSNTSTVSELFVQFLQHYEAFDFGTHAVTLRTREKMQKPQHDAIWIDNLFNPAQPMASNVVSSECSSLKYFMQDTIQELQHYSMQADPNQNWGLLEILSKLK